MSFYEEKAIAALQKVEHRDLSNGENQIDAYQPERMHYHVMYHPTFTGFFLYKLFGETGEIMEGGSTWWGFEPELAANEAIADAYEQPLQAVEVEPWLFRNYGHLTDPADYIYLMDLLHTTSILGQRQRYNFTSRYNYGRAMAWLQLQIAHKSARQPALDGKAALINANDHISMDTVVETSPWTALLNSKLSLDEFYKFLEACGLLTPAGELTALGRADGPLKARKAPWVGTLQSLMQAGLLNSNVAAVCRALAAPAGKLGVKLSNNALLLYSAKAGAYLKAANGHLLQRGLLRN